MLKVFRASGQVVKTIITAQGALLLVEKNVQGTVFGETNIPFSTTFDFADVKNDLAQVNPIMVKTGEAEGDCEYIVDNTAVVLSKEGYLYMYIKGDVNVQTN